DQVINRVYSSNINIIDDKILKRKEELIKQARWIINLIPRLARRSHEQKNPWINHDVLKRLVKYGIFDAPHLKNNKFALGQIETRMINGACYSWNNTSNKKLDEIERIKDIIASNPDKFLSQEQFKKEDFSEKVMIQ
ncbi:MAG: hypothetical protein ACTSRI_15820, partial [Promethearchaeota archaeon]